MMDKTVNGLYDYPVLYINSIREDFKVSQISALYSYEKNAGPICNETGIDDVLLDFNAGLRLQIPNGNFHVRIMDFDTETVFLDDDVTAKTIISAEKFFIKWQVDIWQDSHHVFSHILDLENQDVYFYMVGAALGDTVAMLEFLPEFQKKHKCNILFTPPDSFKEICRNYYPNLNILKEAPKEAYASYCLAVFQLPPFVAPQDSRIWDPFLAARSILQLYHNPQHIIYKPDKPRLVKEKYVCVAVQASGIMKRWLYPNGWNIVVSYLKTLGYRVLCIDGEDYFKEENYIINIPAGAENYTGMLPIMERVNLLAYADFFIGLGSGLSWLAWACNIPVVLISGFSLPMGEFDTPYRVTNQLVCHGCYNDIRVNWKDRCPYHRRTNREYECSKNIVPKQVIAAIDRLIADKL